MAFKINRVYTRSGDDGMTALVGGRRVWKNDLRVEAYGTIDEVNSAIGELKVRLNESTKAVAADLERLQQELFDLGSQLATPPSAAYEGMWEAKPTHVTRLENLCDQYGESLPELTSFILPGGSSVASACHSVRTITRRAERVLVAMMTSGDPDLHISPEALQYVNRLSDLMFVLSRWSLKQEKIDVPLWVKEESR